MVRGHAECRIGRLWFGIDIGSRGDEQLDDGQPPQPRGDRRHQFGPTGKSVFTGNDMLGILQGDACFEEVRSGPLCPFGGVTPDASHRFGVGRSMGFEQGFDLLLEGVEMGTGGQSFGHRDTLFLANA